ncbi:MAG: HD domain-containing protein [Lachnospiraceae bacterium]|nr:HD domain-containing protein [Lachnospiraceae bacterium]
MRFVKTEDLKEGMRLAKPIYNKQGVLLFERDSKISQQSIASVKNVGLLGLYVLEPAEPLPPMSKDDLEFERFQTMVGFSLQEELEKILEIQKQSKTHTIANMIIKNFGHLDKKINFYQNLRSREDYVCKHCLNVAILCTMMTHEMNVRLDEQLATVIAAMVHDIGKLALSPGIVEGDNLTLEQREYLYMSEVNAYDIIEKSYSDGMMIRRICAQSQRMLAELRGGESVGNKTVQGARILAVADAYDTMTAMKMGAEPTSEIKAIKTILEHPEVFDPAVVKSLCNCINILIPGVSVELNTGEKAMILRENPDNLLKPMLLTFNDNTVIDLSDEKTYDDIEIVDVMKTMDNRYVMGTEMVQGKGNVND